MALSPSAALARIAPALLFLIACTDSTPTGVIDRSAKVRSVAEQAGLDVIPLSQSPSVPVGETVQLTTSLRRHGRSATLVWWSDNSDVASIDSDGLVKGVSVGTATITAAIGHELETATITVVAAAPAPTPAPGPAVRSVTVVVKSSLQVGETAQAVANAIDSTGHPMSGATFTWSTSNDAVLSISETGLVTAKSAGTAVITATAGGSSATASVTVTASAPPSVDPTPSSPPSTATGGTAELPRSYVDTRYVQPTGRTISVAPGGDLQAALNSAQRGDVIVLQAGAAYPGPVTLPAKGGSAADGWITVRTSASDGVLPPPGTRITPRDASALASVVTPDYRPAIRTAAGASGWRLTGLEVTVSSAFGGQQYGLVVMGEGDETSMSQFAQDIILDRAWVHGQSQTDLMRCVSMNGIRVAVVDSWISACHGSSGDSQAIAGWNGPGPTKIADNYLEGAAENVIFGGSDPGVEGLVPSDIEIVGNHFFKPLSWRGGPWQIKNLLELKNAQRVLIEGNVFQNSWAAAQDGWAFIWASHNQYGGSWGSWSVVRDVTFRYNRVDNVEGGFNLAERYDGSATSGARFTIANNLITNVGFSDSGDLDRLYLVSGNLADVAIEHNTGFAPKAYLQFGDQNATPKPRLTFKNNLGGNSEYVYNSPLGDGAVMFSAYGVSLTDVTGSCIVTPDAQGMPLGNVYTNSLSLLGILNPSGFTGDYRLSSTSPCRGKATDGSDPGADISTLMSKTARSIVQ